MSLARRFRHLWRHIVPRHFAEGEGELIGYSLGVVVDAFLERARQGLIARFPQRGTHTALGAIGRDRRIVRGIAESREAFAARLITWLDDHPRRGSPYALLEQLRAYCQADVRVRTVDARGNWYTIDRDGTKSRSLDTGNWDWDGAPVSPRWARFWVIIYPTSDNEPWAPEGTWADDGVYGDGGVWGTTATPAQVADVRNIIREWSPNGTRCEWIIIAFDDASFDPAAPEPDGTWGRWSKVSGGVAVPSRLGTARYWRGRKAA